MASKLTYANVVSTVCLFLLLGGAAVAASKLSSNSVGSRELKNNSVTSKELKGNAVDSSKIADGSIDSPDPGPGSVAGEEIADGSIDSPDLGPGSVAGDDIANGSVGSPAVADGSLNAGDLADGTIPTVTPPGGTLPAGTTLRGVIGPGNVCNLGGCSFGARESASFGGYRLPARPTPRVIPIGGPATANCPGSAVNPEAASGFLCVYLNTLSPAAGGQIIVLDPTTSALNGINFNTTGSTTTTLGDGKVSALGFHVSYSPAPPQQNSTFLDGSWAVRP